MGRSHYLILPAEEGILLTPLLYRKPIEKFGHLIFERKGES